MTVPDPYASPPPPSGDELFAPPPPPGSWDDQSDPLLPEPGEWTIDGLVGRWHTLPLKWGRYGKPETDALINTLVSELADARRRADQANTKIQTLEHNVVRIQEFSEARERERAGVAKFDGLHPDRDMVLAVRAAKKKQYELDQREKALQMQARRANEELDRRFAYAERVIADAEARADEVIAGAQDQANMLRASAVNPDEMVDAMPPEDSVELALAVITQAKAMLDRSEASIQESRARLARGMSDLLTAAGWN